MTLPNRRTFLGGLGAGMLAQGASANSHAASRAPKAIPSNIDELVTLVQKTPHDELLAKAMELHALPNGPDWRDLLAAAFLAGVRDVEPRPVGFQFHCVMMTNSAFSIARRAPANERLAAALFNLDEFKRSQARDARNNDWSLPAAPATDILDEVEATSLVTFALGNWDLDSADGASTALANCASLDEAFEPLWWYALRDFTNIGHNPIFVAQSHRTLQHIGWRHGRDVMRSLVYGLLDGKPGAEDATFRSNNNRAAMLVLPTIDGSSRNGLDAIAAELQGGTTESASAAAATALGKGLSLRALWDELRLFAAEQSWRDPGILTAHAMTSINALRYIAGKATTAKVRSMAVLQAVAYQVLYRDFLSARGSYDSKVAGIDAIREAPAAPGAEAIFTAASANPREAAPLVMRTPTENMPQLMTQARHWLARKPRDAHDYKFAAALLEEMQDAEPAVRKRMFAASLGYLRKPGDRDHALWAMVSGK
ncbi:MAG: hypothetical protein ACI89X_000997 [Planctomycetota bacterium]|jgi:hypothetical protein